MLLLLRVDRISLLAVFCGLLLPCYLALPLQFFHVFLTCFQSFFLSFFFSLIYLCHFSCPSSPAIVSSLPLCLFFTLLGFVLPSLTSFYPFLLFFPSFSLSLRCFPIAFLCHSLMCCLFCYCGVFLLKFHFSLLDFSSYFFVARPPSLSRLSLCLFLPSLPFCSLPLLLPSVSGEQPSQWLLQSSPQDKTLLCCCRCSCPHAVSKSAESKSWV